MRLNILKNKLRCEKFTASMRIFLLIYRTSELTVQITSFTVIQIIFIIIKLERQLVNYNNNLTLMKIQYFMKLANDLYSKIIVLIIYHVLYKIHE